nr:hypothetical protein [Clostridia bacterium]
MKESEYWKRADAVKKWTVACTLLAYLLVAAWMLSRCGGRDGNAPVKEPPLEGVPRQMDVADAKGEAPLEGNGFVIETYKIG